MEQNLQALGLKVVSELRATIFPNVKLPSPLKGATLDLFLALESDLNVGNYEPSSETETAYKKFLKQFASNPDEDSEEDAPIISRPAPTGDDLYEDERP